MRHLRFLPFATVVAGVLLGWLLIQLAEGRPVSVLNRQPPGVTASATTQTNWRYVRNVNAASNPGAVTADDANADPNAMTWTNTVNDYVQLEPYENTVSLSFYTYGDANGHDPNDPNQGTVDVNVYVAEPYGSWEHVASVSLTIGELELTHNPVTGAAFNNGALEPNEAYKWAEGPGTDNLDDPNAWAKPVGRSGRTNGIFRLNVDTLGAQALIVRYHNMSKISRIYGVVKGR